MPPLPTVCKDIKLNKLHHIAREKKATEQVTSTELQVNSRVPLTTHKSTTMYYNEQAAEQNGNKHSNCNYLNEILANK